MTQTVAPFTKQDASNARRSYQHVAAVVNRLLNRIMQGLDEEGRKAFKPSVFHTVHALHAFFHGQDLSKPGKALSARKRKRAGRKSAASVRPARRWTIYST
ncbi:MAG TPA: hypothetical protein VF588_12110 [Pyrinomonadaceae bacterium]|jgi:hypothetical protein